MKVVVLIIFVIEFSFCLSSCNSYQRKVRNIVKEWSGKEIVFPSLDAKIMGRDTIISCISDYKYKILTYIDTTGCSACRLRLFDWKILKKEIDKLPEEVPLFFVVQSKNYKEFEEIQKVNKFTYPVYYDYDGMLDKMNHFPDDPNFQTFLLDKNNRVVVIGNPVTNDKMWQIYIDVIRGDISLE